MKPNATLEDCLHSLGSSLRQRPPLADRVMNEIRRSIAAGPVAEPSQPLPHPPVRRRWPLLTATAAALVAAMLMTWMLSPTLSVSWADVAKSLNSQEWIRATTTYLEGKHGTVWLSPQRKLWAWKTEDTLEFSDGRQRAKYRYRPADKQITKLPLGQEDAERIFPVEDLTRDKAVLGPWLFGSEKIVEQNRRQITEEGRTWIEFQFVLWRGETNQGTLRVDPQTKLPVYLLLASPDATKTLKWQFDYPSEGPTDIYALGAPPGAKVDDRMPSDESLRVVDAVAASRARIGDFRLIVADHPGYPSHVVSRKGDRWRVDLCYPKGAVDVTAQPPEGQTWGDWLEERLKLCHQIPWYLCDGKTVYKNASPQPDMQPISWQPSRHTAPQDLLSGERESLLPHVTLVSLLFPDFLSSPGLTFQFDPHPADAPGYLLIKQSAQVASAKPLLAHEWYYLDPQKGYAVVRAERFTLPPDVPAKPESSRGQTLRMDDFQQSPHGFWYPTVVHDTMPVALDQNPPDQVNPEGKAAPTQVKSTVRYHFDFAAPLPDSLFAVEDQPQTKEKPNH